MTPCTSWCLRPSPRKLAFRSSQFRPARASSSSASRSMRTAPGGACWAKVKQLIANARVLNRSSLVFQGVGNGEYALGISLEYAGYIWAAGGAPVKTIYPDDGTLAQMEGVAIIRGGPSTEAAKAFVDYINRKNVREMII